MTIPTDQLTWDYPDPHLHSIRIVRSDIDGMGHENNACHVVRCEQRAWRHSESLGLNIKNYQHLNRGVAIRKATYEYFLPAFENEDLFIATWLTACDGKLRLQRRFQMINVTIGKAVQRSYWS